MSVAVAESQVAQALDIGAKAVRLQAVKDSWPVVKKTRRGGSEQFFIRDLLPVKVQESLVLRDSTMPGAGLPAVIHDTPVPDKSNKIGMAKYNLVHAYRLAKLQAPWGGKGQAAEEFALAYNANVLLEKVYLVIGPIQKKTMDALDKKLQKNDDNYLALCDGRGGWKMHGTNKYKGRKLSETAKAVFLKCYLHGARPSTIMAIRAAKRTLENKGLPDNASESTWSRWLKDYERQNAGVICLARNGMKAYQDLYGPYITRDASLLKVGQCLVADGKTFNFFIKHPETGRKCRMTLIVFFDWASRYPAGWQIMPTESQYSILAAFRNSVQALGRYPDMVYLDNGRAFKAKVFTHTDPDFNEMTGLYGRVGTGVTLAKPYNGRAKVVERFFKTLQMQLEWIMPSYCGDSISTKPPWMNRNEKYQQAWHEARTQGWIPTIQEAATILEGYFQWYGQQPHSDLPAPPGQLFLEGKGPGVDVKQLNYDFLIRKEVRPRHCRVTLWGIDYESDCLHNFSRKHSVIAMIDAANLNRIYCYTKDGIFLGEAYPVQACHPLARAFGDQSELECVVTQNKRQASLAKKTREQLTALGVTKDAQDSLNILPFAGRKPKTAILPASDEKKPVSEKQISEKEVERLEAVFKEAEAEMEALPEIPRPKYWQSDLEHYEWCFNYIYKHERKPEEADAGFMKKFASLPEFDQYRQRFEDLKSIYK